MAEVITSDKGACLSEGTGLASLSDLRRLVLMGGILEEISLGSLGRRFGRGGCSSFYSKCHINSNDIGEV